MIWHLPVILSPSKAPAFGMRTILAMLHLSDGCLPPKRQVCTDLSTSICQVLFSWQVISVHYAFIHSFVEYVCLPHEYSPE